MHRFKNPRKIGIVLLVASFLFATVLVDAAAGTQTGSEFFAPFASSIAKDELDGIIGSEWHDASKVEIRLGRFATELWQKNDGENLYIAMEIKTNRRYSEFEGYVFFDDGDGRDYRTGDDIISVMEQDGKLVNADYYFKKKYDFRLDTRVGGVNNAWAAGKYDPDKKVYVFEFVRELTSGDGKDVSLNQNDTVTVVYGWASY